MKRTPPSVKPKAPPMPPPIDAAIAPPNAARPPLAREMLPGPHMQGVITEQHFEMAERMFPGIRDFYDLLDTKPLTFLELVWAYERQVERLPCRTRPRAGRTARRRPR